MADIGYIQVTRACNQECLICSNPPTDQTLDFETACRQVDELVQKGCAGVILTGGEPTLYEQLADLIAYCCRKKIFPRLITNGQKTADRAYLESLVQAGLRHVHVSLYSCDSGIQARLTGNTDSFQHLRATLDHLAHMGRVAVNVNIVITRYNADHLSRTISWLISSYPRVRHIVFNNLDPYMGRVENHPDVIPKLNDFELELHKALTLLHADARTVRVERVPLCYLTDFEHVSTETRKIVKSENRTVFFLYQRGRLDQENWIYKKPVCCRSCSLNSICAGLYEKGAGPQEKELYPVFIDPQTIIQKILGDT